MPAAAIPIAAGIAGVGVGAMMGGGGSSAPAPQTMSPGQVGADSLATQLQLAPDVFAANQKYDPQYAGLQTQILAQTLTGKGGFTGGLLDLYNQLTPQLNTLQSTANTASRTANITDVQNLGPQATAAYYAANPGLLASMNSLAGATNAYAGSLSPVQLAAQQRAMDLVTQGGDLSDQDIRNVQQNTRAAYAARGMYDSNAAIGDEVMNTDAARRARLLQNLNTGMTVDAAGQTQTQNRLQALMGLAGMYQAQAQNPYYTVLGQSNAPSAAAGAVGQAGFTQQPMQFNPFNPEVDSIYNSNLNAVNATNIANANSRAAITGAGLGMLGNLGGAGIMAMGMCWVARAVYGAGDDRWLKFRAWMLERASDKLRGWYREHGPAIAEAVGRDAAWKERLRALMDRAIARVDNLNPALA